MAEGMIRTLSDLCQFFGADEPRQLPRRVYKDTACGAAIEVVSKEGRAWNGSHDEWEQAPEDIACFSIGSIVEGSEVTFDREFVLPVAESAVSEWLDDLEELTSEEWKRANPAMPQDEALSLAVRDLSADERAALLISACREVPGMYEWLCGELESEISALMEPGSSEETT